MRNFNCGDNVRVVANMIPLTMLYAESVDARVGEVGLVHSYEEGSVKVLFSDGRKIYFTESMLEKI